MQRKNHKSVVRANKNFLHMQIWKNMLRKTIQTSNTNADTVLKLLTQHPGTTSTRRGIKASGTSVVLILVRNFSSLVTNFVITSRNTQKKHCIHAVLMAVEKVLLLNVLTHIMNSNIAYQIRTISFVTTKFEMMPNLVEKLFKERTY